MFVYLGMCVYVSRYVCLCIQVCVFMYLGMCVCVSRYVCLCI
jgi:hypothetical protein